MSKRVTVDRAEPVANFGASIKGLTVQFEDKSTGNPTNWEWDFGDGKTSSVQSPTHTYTEGGTYTVTLKVATGGGESTTSKKISHECDDRFLTYQLSYIQSGEALALLKALDFNTEKFAAKGTPPSPAKKLSELGRPAVVELEDLASASIQISAQGTTNLGGRKLDPVTAATPEQRLLVVWDSCAPEEARDLLQLLDQKIDVPAKQILIEALVVELGRDRFKDLGFSYEGSKDGQKAELSFDGTSLFSFTRPSAKTLLNFTARLQALVDRGHATVLSRPSLLVLDGRQARIKVGDKVPYASVGIKRGGILSEDTEYIDVGITLNMRPRASDDNSEVSMQIETLVSSTSPSSSPSAAGPPISTRQVQTTVRIANDTPFIIAGLISSTEDDRIAGIPVLSRIPGLGKLFRRSTRLRDDTEIVVIIVPHVIPPEDRSFSYTTAKDSDLFNQAGLELFRDIYRVRSDDIFDLDFIRESSFYQCLEKTAKAQAEKLSELLSQSGRPVAGGDIAGLARALRGWAAEDPGGFSIAAREQFAAVGAPPESTEMSAVTGQFIDLLEGRVPGEDILIKRMLLALVEKLELGQFVRRERIIFFKDKSEEASDPAAGGQAILDVERLADELGPLDRKCTTVRLLYPTGETSTGLLFDPPSARIRNLGPIDDEDFVCELRKKNCLSANGSRWPQLAVFLNDCYRRRGQTTLDLLRSVLVLKRLLDLNPTLPLSLEDFHVGREVVVPTPEDLEERHHLVDREAAELFFTTLDYYYAFELKIRRGFESILRLGLELPPGCTADAAGADPPTEAEVTGRDTSCACPATQTASRSGAEGTSR